jgi:DNA-binding transcriptional regulator WhiA
MKQNNKKNKKNIFKKIKQKISVKEYIDYTSSEHERILPIYYLTTSSDTDLILLQTNLVKKNIFLNVKKNKIFSPSNNWK